MKKTFFALTVVIFLISLIGSAEAQTPPDTTNSTATPEPTPEPEPTPPTTDTTTVDVDYNPLTSHLGINWDLDVDQADCFMITNVHFWLTDGTRFVPKLTFLGTDFTLWDVSGISMEELSRDPNALIPCTGEFEFNVIDDLPTPDDFESYTIDIEFFEQTDNIPTQKYDVIVEYAENYIYTSNENYEPASNVSVCNTNALENNTSFFYDPEKFLKAVTTSGDCVVTALPYPDDGFTDAGFTNIDYTPETINFSTYIPYDGQLVPTENRGGGGCSGDCTPPTLGKLENGRQYVMDGFNLNGYSVDVTGYHTEFPLINATVGQENMIHLKVYENQGPENIKWIQVGIGMEDIGDSINSAEALVLVEFDNQGLGIENIQLTDPNNLLANVTAIALTSQCNPTGPEDQCMHFMLHYTHLEAPIHNVVVVQPMDQSRNSHNYYLNDGYDVLGDSMNPAPTMQTTVGHAGYSHYPQKSGIVELVRIDKDSNTWIDSYGHKWTVNDYGPKLLDDITPQYQCNDPPLDTINVPTRSNCHFRELTTIWDK